jgi:hypothetical protein
MSPLLQGDYIVDLLAISSAATELPGGLFEVDVPVGPVAGAFLSRKLTTEQLVDYLGGQGLGGGLLSQYLTNTQQQLQNGTPLESGVQYLLTGDWNASGEADQAVAVHAATTTRFRTNGTLFKFNQAPQEVVVDVAAGTAVAVLATLAARAANLYAHYADNTVAPFATLDAFLAAAGLHGGTLRLEGEATALSLTATNRGNWPAFWDAAGATIVVPAGVALTSSAAGAENFSFSNFYLTGDGTFVLSGQLAQNTPPGRASLCLNGQCLLPFDNPANVVTLDGGYYKKITGAGKYYLTGTVQVDDLSGASNVVDLRGGGGGGTGTVKSVNGTLPDAVGNVTLSTHDIYAIADNTTVVAAVVGGTFSSGELQGAQPTGSAAGDEFTTSTYGYKFQRGASGSLVWCRYPKG